MNQVQQVIENTVVCPACNTNMVAEVELIEVEESHMVCLVCNEHFLADLSD